MEQDNPWKEVVGDLFKDFLAFFFTDIHNDIDFSKGYEFLQEELLKIEVASETGKRYNDKLAKVFLKDGSEQWLLIHIEIQGYEEENFPERMYIYNYRIFDKHRKEVVSLAILTDKNPDFKPGDYRRERWNFHLIFSFPTIKVPEELEREIINAVRTIEYAKDMPHMTTAERLGREEGMQQGMQQGIKQMLLSQVDARFGVIPEEIQEKIHAMKDAERLKQIARMLITAQSLEELRRAMD